MIYPETGKTISQTLMGRHLRGALPAISSFYQLKKDFVMERKEREILAAKMTKKQEAAFNKGSKSLPQLEEETK